MLVWKGLLTRQLDLLDFLDAAKSRDRDEILSQGVVRGNTTILMEG